MHPISLSRSLPLHSVPLAKPTELLSLDLESDDLGVETGGREVADEEVHGGDTGLAGGAPVI